MATGDKHAALPSVPERQRSEVGRLARGPAARPDESTLRELLELAHEGIFVRDMDDAVTYWNRGAEDLYGWTAAEALGHVSHSLLQTVFPAPIERINDVLLRTGRWEGELQHTCKDGAQVVVQSRWALQRDAHGAPAGVLETNDDITERKRAEQAGHELQELWRAAFEANPAMYFIVDEAGTIVSVNHFGGQQLGYAPGELVGQPVLNVFLPADRAFVQENAKRCFSHPGHALRWEARKVRKDGQVLWVRETANAVMLRNRPVVLVACEDVTEHRRVEDALRQREKELRDIVETMPAMAFVTDAAGRDVIVNRRWIEFTGLGREGGTRAAVHPEDAKRYKAARRHSLATGERFEQEVRLRRFDGEYRWFLGRAVPLHDEQGRVLKWYGVHTDIHDRKVAEEERAAHLWFLESMDRIHRALQGTDDLEQMLSDVLDAVLEVFDCDRAWLIYPCDPEAPSWRAVMEHTRPEFAGAFALGADVPTSPDMADVFRKARAAKGAVLFGPGYELPVAERSGRYAVRSRMAMAVRPKVDRAYLFGLHQCAHPRVWTAQERRLFEEIGHRLDDALTSVLILRSLRESERKLEEAQRIAHLGYFELDLGEQRLTLSDEACRIHGIEQDQLPSWQGRAVELVHPDDRARLVDTIRAARDGDGRFDLEVRAVRPSGEVRVVHSRGRVAPGASLGTLRAFGTLQDVTELRRAQEELVASELRHRRIFNGANVSIWEEDFSRVEAEIAALRRQGVSDFRGYIAAHPEFTRRAVGLVGIRDVNDATLRLFGAQSKNHLLVSLDRVFVRETETMFAEELVALAEGRTSFQGETVVRNLQGEQLAVLFTVAFPPPGATSASTLVSMMDITEPRRAQQLTRHIFESAPDAMAVLGPDARYRRVNPACERTWKMPAERIVGLHARDLYGSDVFEQILRPHLELCFAGEQVAFADWFTTPRGRCYASVVFAPLKGGSAQVEAALAITRDLTDHMLASEALRDAEAALARVNRVTTVGVLAASIAHEVNQPLGAMTTSAASAMRWLAAEPPGIDKARAALQRITGDGRRAAQVIDRIRALVNRQPPRRDSVDLNEAIVEVIALSRDEVRRNAITLDTSLAPDLPLIEGDRVQLQQVVMNLIVNAIDALRGCAAPTRELTIRSVRDGPNCVTVEVRDSGPGVDPGQAHRLFEAFYTTKDHGFGMGLSISRSIIEAHGGRLWVTPNPPHGAAFWFSLPVEAPVA